MLRPKGVQKQYCLNAKLITFHLFHIKISHYLLLGVIQKEFDKWLLQVYMPQI